MLSYEDGFYKLAFMNVIYNFLIGSFLFQTKSYCYAIKQDVMLPNMVTLLGYVTVQKTIFPAFITVEERKCT